MKFIHIADIHLGAKPDKDKGWAKERELHGWQALTEVVDKAKEEHLQLLLIAGDLFHRQPLTRELKEVNKLFSQIPRTQVVLIAGERDHLAPNSCYQEFSWEKNVHFLKSEQAEYIELPGLDVRVYGVSYWRRENSRPLLEGIQVKEGEFSNILLAHGGDDDHLPFQEEDLSQCGFDYVALGHIHKPMQIVEDKVVMAGALQPIECSDLGEHGYFEGEIKEHQCHVEFVPLHYCEYVSLKLKVSPEITQEALQEYVASRIRVAPAYQKFRITLSGYYDKDTPVDAQKIMEMYQVVQVVNQCHAEFDFEKLKQQFEEQFLGRFIQEAQKMPQDEIARRALYYGVEALMEE